MAGSRPRRAGEVMTLGLALVLSTLAVSAAGGSDVPRNTLSLRMVFEVARPSDTDVLVLSGGAQRRCSVQADAVQLRTPHGRLRLPTRVIAGIDLGAAQGAQDSVVTTSRDLFQGTLEDAGFLVSAEPNAVPALVRREKVHKLILRVRPGEPQALPHSWLIQLRDGCFFHGQMADTRLRVVGSTAELRTTAEDILALVFLAGETPSAQVHLATGEVVRATTSEEDLTFETDVGIVLNLYHEHVQEMRRAGPLPDHLLRRLGMPPGAPGSLSSAQGTPDATVTPIDGMKWIVPGEFVMGSPTHEAGRDLDEGPLTTVIFDQGFWLGDHEVTQAEYEAVMPANPSQYLGDGQRPVEKVSWQEALEYCRRLSERERVAGRLPADYAYRLPTEAEWEYACRAGTRTRFSFGDDPGRTQIGDFAWYGANSDSAPHRVRLKQPNPWGLYDLHGNVLEWCLDEWKGALPGGTLTNRVALPAGTLRVARGGSWLYEGRFCRSANRDSYGLLNRCSDVGFRVALSRLGGLPERAEPTATEPAKR